MNKKTPLTWPTCLNPSYPTASTLVPRNHTSDSLSGWLALRMKTCMLRRCRPLALERVVVTGEVVAATATATATATVAGAARVQGVQGRGYLQQKQSIWRKHHIREMAGC